MDKSKTAPKTTVLVVGATGATGRHVVHQLLKQREESLVVVKAIVRSKQRLLDSLSGIDDAQKEVKDDAKIESSTTTAEDDGVKRDYEKEERLVVKEAAVLDLSDEEMEEMVSDVDGVISCLGHNMTFNGMYRHPRLLVTDAAKRLTKAMMKASEKSDKGKKRRYILMGSDGVAHPDGKTDDVRPMSERFVLTLLRWLVPPVTDNEMAAAYLYEELGAGGKGGDLEWCIVRPTDLVDSDVTSEFKLHEKPVGSLFGGGAVSRINVAKCITDLALSKDDNGEESLWTTWKYRMPAVRNVDESGDGTVSDGK